MIAIKSINFYQKELSHKKKYHCAHRALHKGLTCSEYSKQQKWGFNLFHNDLKTQYF